MCLWKRPFFPKAVTLIFDLDRWPWTCYHEKGLVTRYTHVKYEAPNSYQLKDMTNVKVLADKQTDKRLNKTNGQKDERTGQKRYALDLSMRGHKMAGELQACCTKTILTAFLCFSCLLSAVPLSLSNVSSHINEHALNRDFINITSYGLAAVLLILTCN